MAFAPPTLALLGGGDEIGDSASFGGPTGLCTSESSAELLEGEAADRLVEQFLAPDVPSKKTHQRLPDVPSPPAFPAVPAVSPRLREVLSHYAVDPIPSVLSCVDAAGMEEGSFGAATELVRELALQKLIDQPDRAPLLGGPSAQCSALVPVGGAPWCL